MVISSGIELQLSGNDEHPRVYQYLLNNRPLPYSSCYYYHTWDIDFVLQWILHYCHLLPKPWYNYYKGNCKHAREERETLSWKIPEVDTIITAGTLWLCNPNSATRTSAINWSACSGCGCVTCEINLLKIALILTRSWHNAFNYTQQKLSWRRCLRVGWLWWLELTRALDWRLWGSCQRSLMESCFLLVLKPDVPENIGYLYDVASYMHEPWRLASIPS